MNHEYASYVLRSSAIFDAKSAEAHAGFVAICGNKIAEVGKGSGQEWIGKETTVLELGNRLVTPGLTDVHCFFNGWLLQHVGADLSDVTDAAEAIQRVRADATSELAIGHDYPLDLLPLDESVLDEAFGDVPAVFVGQWAEGMAMNTAAEWRFRVHTSRLLVRKGLPSPQSRHRGHDTIDTRLPYVPADDELVWRHLNQRDGLR